jgi:hypothetical protein
MESSLSAALESRLLHHFEQIVRMLDGDATSRAVSQMIATRLSGWRSVQVVRVPDGSQPDQLSCSTIRRYWHSRLPERGCHGKQHSVLRGTSLAGFQVIIYGRF